MVMRRRFLQLLAAALAATAAPAFAQRAPYPHQPVKVVFPFLPGGAGDMIARLVSENLSQRLGQQFVVENRSGAGGTIGADAVAKASPDGYTLLFAPQGPFVINPFLMKDLPYDPLKAFAPVSVVVEAPNVLAINPQLPFRTVADFIAYAKAHPEKMTYASQGIGTTGHITGAMINKQVGIELTHVAYKGFPPMLADVLSGRVGMMITDTINILPRVRSKELEPIAVAGAKRSPMLPNVPTFAESGYPGVVAGPWFSMVAPAGTPLEIREKLAREIHAVLQIPAVNSRLTDLGVEVRGTQPKEFEAFLKSEYKRWGDAIRAAGIAAR